MMLSKSSSLLSDSEGKPISELALAESIDPPERLLNVFKGHKNIVYSVAYSPDGKFIASSSIGDGIRIWNAETGTLLISPPMSHGKTILSVSYSPDGKYIVSGSHDNSISFWDAYTGKRLGEPLEAHTDTVWSVSYSPDGRKIVSGSRDSTILVWDMEIREIVIGPLKCHSDDVYIVAYSPNGRKIISGSKDRTVIIWDASTGDKLQSTIHPSAVVSVSFSPDGKCFASACDDNNVYLWSSDSGSQLLSPLKGHSRRIWGVSFAPNGKYVASCSCSERTIRIWDVENGNETMPAMEVGRSRCLAYSPDGNCIVFSDDSMVRTWDVRAVMERDDERSRGIFKEAERLQTTAVSNMMNERFSTISSTSAHELDLDEEGIEGISDFMKHPANIVPQFSLQEQDLVSTAYSSTTSSLIDLGNTHTNDHENLEASTDSQVEEIHELSSSNSPPQIDSSLIEGYHMSPRETSRSSSEELPIPDENILPPRLKHESSLAENEIAVVEEAAPARQRYNENNILLIEASEQENTFIIRRSFIRRLFCWL